MTNKLAHMPVNMIQTTMTTKPIHTLPITRTSTKFVDPNKLLTNICFKQTHGQSAHNINFPATSKEFEILRQDSILLSILPSRHQFGPDLNILTTETSFTKMKQ